MNIKQNKSGFTLLEIIIVVIIIGVLASLALPRFLNTVQNTYQSEAWQNVSAIRGSMYRCNTTENNYGNCDVIANDLDLADPGNEAGAHFSYAIGAAANTFRITATRNTLGGGDGTSTVFLNQDDTVTPATVVRGGTGIWSNI